MSPSPYAQRPIVYHFVGVPLSVVARMCTSIHVPAGVDAFHEEISSLKPKPVENQGDVQVPLVTPPAGNWKAWKPTLYCCAADVGAARTSASASAASVPRITGRLYTRSRIERRCALRGRHRGDCCATVFSRVGSKDRGRRPEALHRAVDAEGQF